MFYSLHLFFNLNISNSFAFLINLNHEKDCFNFICFAICM